MSGQQQRALIIGGASGMGLAGVEALVRSGWELVVADLVPTPLDGVREVLRADLGDEASLTAAIDRTADLLGGIDAVWNHAGILITGTAETTALADLDRVYALNVRANVIIARAVLPHLRAAGGGSLLFTASTGGVALSKGALPYTVTKSALITLTRLLALEYAQDNIRVNALCPGWVDTSFNAPAWELFGGRDSYLDKIPELIPLGRMIELSEVAELVDFVLSPAGKSITGQALVIDGGESLIKGPR